MSSTAAVWWQDPQDDVAVECAVCGVLFERGETVLCEDLSRVCWSCFIDHDMRPDDAEIL